MNNILNNLNLVFESVPDFVRRYKKSVWITFLALNLLILMGLPKFKVDLTLDAYLQENDPIKMAYDQFRAQFGSDAVIRIIYEANDGDIFSDESLRAISQLQGELTHYQNDPISNPQLENIVEITSIINASYISADGDSLTSLPFIGKNFPISDADREAVRNKALSYGDYSSLYLSEDSRWGAMVIRTSIGAHIEEDILIGEAQAVAKDARLENDVITDYELDLEEYEIDFNDSEALETHYSAQPPKFKPAAAEDHAALWHAIKPYLEKSEYSQHLTFHSTGAAPLQEYRLSSQVPERMRILFICLALITAILCILFRSFSAVVWPITIILLSILWVFGIVGWSGLLVTELITLIMFLMIAVGVADAMHILSGYLFFRQQKQQCHEQALRSVFKKSGLACLLTTVTTAIGLLSLTLIPIVPLRHFGLFAAGGVFIAFLLTIFVLPLMLDLWSPYSDKRAIRRGNHQHPIQRLLQKIEGLSYTYPKSIITLFIVLSFAFAIGALKVEVSQSMVKSLLPESEIRKDFELADDVLGGSTSAEIMLYAGQRDAFKDPEILNKMEILQSYIESTYPNLVATTQSIVNTTKRSYQALHDNSPTMYKIPKDARTLEQTLFMFNNATAIERRRWVSDDYSSARITILLKTEGSGVYVDVFDDIQTKIDELFLPVNAIYPDFSANLTGSVALVMAVADYINDSQIRSFGTALIVISILVMMVFSSALVGFIAILPNLFPVLVAFGTLGYLGLPLDTGTLMIAPIIIGIVVDDTIHFLTHYRAEVIQNNNIQLAIRNTIREVGQAISFTSIVLALGFLVYLGAPDLTLQNFGLASALAILAALFSDLFLLPALCFLFKVDFKQKKLDNKDAETISAEVQ